MVFTGISLGIILSVSRGERDEFWQQQPAVKDKQPEMKAA
jgi:hypothetical protein